MSLKCTLCSKQLGSKSSAVECSSCETSYHAKCVDIDKQICDALKTTSGFRWLCHKCCVTDKTEEISNRDNCKGCKLIPQFLEMMQKLNDSVDMLKQEIVTLKKAENHDNFEEVVSEVLDRLDRRRNLVFFGVREADESLSTSECIAADGQLLKEFTSFVNPSGCYIAESTKIQRLGRKNISNTPRPIKITLRNDTDALQFIRHMQSKRQALKNHTRFGGISVSLDRTAKQISYYKQVKANLDTRREAGEEDLIIRYVRGIPKIVNASNGSLN